MKKRTHVVVTVELTILECRAIAGVQKFKGPLGYPVSDEERTRARDRARARFERCAWGALLNPNPKKRGKM